MSARRCWARIPAFSSRVFTARNSTPTCGARWLRRDEWSGELWNRNKSGDVYAEMKTITSVRDASGKLVRYVALFSDITQVKKHAQQLEHVTHYDLLTNLPNRALLADRLQQAMAQAKRRNQKVAVAYLDLDGFRGVNDKHGRDVGDRLLTSLAFNMKCALREGDTLAQDRRGRICRCDARPGRY